MSRFFPLLILAISIIGINTHRAMAGKPKVIIMTEGFSTIQGTHPVEGWDQAFKDKFKAEIDQIIDALTTDKIDVGQTGETGNFGLKIVASLQWDCTPPCTGPNILQTQTLVIYFKLFDPVLGIEVDAFSFEKKWEYDNADPSVWLNRTWTEFILNIQRNKHLSERIEQVTTLKTAGLSFRPKNLGDKKPMEADGKKHGYLKINQIISEKNKYPVGETTQNPLTRYRLSVNHGYLINKGQEVKSIEFGGDEFITKRANFEFEYRVYECNCDRYEVFELKVIEQNGESVDQVVETLKEEFKCYGYTLKLDYRETNAVSGTTKITATWECFRVNFGDPNKKPVEMDMSSLSTGQAIDTNGDLLQAPYTIPHSTERGFIHVSQPTGNKIPGGHTYRSSGGPWAEISGGFKIDFSNDALTNPPDLVWAKNAVSSSELCGGNVPAGVYLEWQFDVWGDLPGQGYSQLYQVAASRCTLVSNVANSITAKVPPSIVELMKTGKAFSFTNSNSYGTYTITGIPQQQ